MQCRTHANHQGAQCVGTVICVAILHEHTEIYHITWIIQEFGKYMYTYTVIDHTEYERSFRSKFRYPIRTADYSVRNPPPLSLGRLFRISRSCIVHVAKLVLKYQIRPASSSILTRNSIAYCFKSLILHFPSRTICSLNIQSLSLHVQRLPPQPP